jgi:hypothetical protein
MVGRLWRSDQSREDPPPRLPRRGQPSLPTRALGNGTIPILGADLLIVCKVVFDRPKDWVDIEVMIAAGAAIKAAEVLR